jgi:hypothetical protein
LRQMVAFVLFWKADELLCQLHETFVFFHKSFVASALIYHDSCFCYGR